MASPLDASFFIPINELDPGRPNQCIHFTLKGKRCRWPLQESDNRRAKELRDMIFVPSRRIVSLELLEDYALINCCGPGEARHRNRLEDRGLLEPLAIRWQDEIRRHFDATAIVPASVPARSAQKSEDSISVKLETIGTRPSPSPAAAKPSTSRYLDDGIVMVGEIRSESTTSLPISPPASPEKVGNSLDLAPTQADVVPRYGLRPRLQKAVASTGSVPNPQRPGSQRILSEFRPHIAEPRYDDTVSFKILSPLQGRDFETGSLYIFKRDSSPGYVKIGWTTQPVQWRLDDWAKCNYTPVLVSSVQGVPHAQRAETLTHYELMKEWRAERMCKATWCRKSHQEWFETSEERAKDVVANWGKFFNIAKPYGLNGKLRDCWQHVIETMNKNGELVTAAKLLEHHNASLAKAMPLPSTERSLADISTPFTEPPKLENFDLNSSSAFMEELAKSTKSLEQQQSTLPLKTEIPQPSTRLSAMNSNSCREFSLQSRSFLPVISPPTPPPENKREVISESLAQWKTLPETMATPWTDRLLSIGISSAGNATVENRVLEVADKPPRDKLQPEQVPLPLSPPPSPRRLSIQ